MLMSAQRIVGVALILSGLALPVAAQEKESLLPPPDRAPHLILAHTGPHAPVTALAFAPDASTLYVGGFDKQVRRYELAKGKYGAAGAFRVPIGPGNAGVVNAIAVSPDGKWVAVAGRAPMRGEDWASTDDGIGTDFRRLLPMVRRDSGVVYLFDPTKPNGGKVIRGQSAGVRALAFANPAPADGPVLITAGVEWNEKKGKALGTVRLFNVTTGEEIASRDDLPATALRPGLAAWATGAKKDGLRVVVAWDDFDDKTGKPLLSKLLTWDNPKTKDARESWGSEALLISPLAVRIGTDGATTEVLNGGYDPKEKSGGLNVRPATGGDPKTLPLKGANDRLLLPTAIAAFPLEGIGDATALLLPIDTDADGQRYELRLLTPKGEQSVALGGFHPQRPVLTASPDGRFMAVAGFKDNRVEVYDAASFATGKPLVEKLAGGTRGFDTVAFLVGEKLWLGSEKDSPGKGGVVLDLDLNVRIAAPAAKDAPKLDAPTAGGEHEVLKPDAAKRLPWRVVVAVGGEKKTIALPDGARPTAVALLPGKPTWDVTLGPIVAVAHVEDDNNTVQVTLFDAATTKPLAKLGGPTLSVRSLAFSDSRALLAAAGEDGTVAVWSLKNIARKWPMIEGVRVTDRAGEVVVASVRPDSPAAGKLKVDDVIESVDDAKGVQKPVKTPRDFVFAIRALSVGDNAQIKVKGKAAVAVAIGAATGFRHPLFALWVDPVAKAGKHDWVGWTMSGPYDTSGETGESRIGWLTATGDPTRPVTFSGANQYRKLFYKRDILRLLLKTADYNEALALYPPPRRPTLIATSAGPTELRAGRLVTRVKPDGLTVELDDPDSVIELDRAELQWQITGPGGVSAMKRESFTSGRAILDLSKYEWKRGEHSVHVRLLKTSPDAPEPALVEEITTAIWFVPPPPVLTVKIDGKPVAVGAEVETMNGEVEVAAAVDAKSNPDGAAVTLSWTGGKPVEVVRNPDGTFAPTKVKLNPEGTTAILVTATNRGDGAMADIESHSVEVRVRKLAPKVVPPPTIKLLVITPHDYRTVASAPFVISTPTATLTATVRDANAVTAFEWKIGEGEWQVGKLDPKTNSETRTINLGELQKDDTKGVEVRVRAKSKDSAFATELVVVRFDGLPEVSVTMPPALVTAPELTISGTLKVTGKRKFTVQALVTSARTGRTRASDPTPDPDPTKWGARITLFPGENQLGYAIKYDDNWKELRRAGLVEVRYVRPPLVIGGSPIEVGTGSVGDVFLAVVSPLDAAPTELWVNGARAGFRTPSKPVKLFGAGLWVLRAEGVPVNLGADRLKPVSVLVRNAEGESQTIELEVRGRPELKVAPPTIRLSHKGKTIAPDQGLPPVGDPKFTFELKVNSETRLTRIEVWRGAGMNTGLERLPAVKVADAVASPAGGFELTANPRIDLRPGATNYIRVVASNDGGTSSVAFNVSYAPPPVRVVLDSIKEPNGNSVFVPSDPTSELQVDKSVIDVEGRVLWDFDDEPIGQDPNLAVVFVANGVAHLPVLVAPVKEGVSKQRTFKGRVYLNTLDPNPKARGVTLVRADLRSGDRPAPIPQEGLQQASIIVKSNNPLHRQRLHVLMIGVEVAEADRKALVQRVIRAVGGKIPDGHPNFTEGPFERRDFESAHLYRPRLDYTNERDLNTLLCATRREIEARTKRPGEEWVNDVIVVYYQGEDWVDKETGRWLLHSDITRSGAAGKNPNRFAIRLDNLPQIPGMPVAVVNSASAAKLGDTLAMNLPFLRYASVQSSANGQFLEQFAKAVSAERTFGGIAEYVNRGALQVATLSTSLPNDGIGSRVVGLP